MKIPAMMMVIFGLFHLPVVFAAPAEPLRLTRADALELALGQNRDLRIARLEVDKSAQQVREAWSAVLPQVSAGFDYTRTIEPTVIYFPEFSGSQPTGTLIPLEISQDNAMSASLSLSQPIFNMQSFAAIRASSLARDISREAWRDALGSTVTAVSISYYNVLIADAQLELVRQSLQRWQQALGDTRALFAEGMVADIDTLKAHLSVENIRPDLLQAENRCASVRTELKNLLGLDPSVRLDLLDSLTWDGGPSPGQRLDELYQEAVQNRPDVRSMELQVEAEAARVGVARGERFPALSAFGQLQAQTQFDDGTALSDTDWPLTSSVGVSLSMPLFTGFRISAAVDQARISRMQAQTRLEQLKADVRADLEVRLASLSEARRRIEVQKTTIRTAERSYDISRLRLREGLGSRLELADAELQLQRARTNYLQAVYDYLVETVRMEASTGRNASADSGMDR
ncbi:TolC family protein [Prosthecochloris sp. N3]|uniref:TolC family protein n=1 Tax=Prosthecochloris ethylica TaxID=2743976 RepID=A0ABR9XSV3_9CHLB|nr:TolC family protein [Prosthecochloris ethylica]MBF0586642.1 TolC family protein [Prosthecochloris ethylica]MBF0637004.1 TolC family protein [Prosthecochloris ethylica]NUK47875.1 TolC family protein [Prosthecochloris ethylica]